MKLCRGCGGTELCHLCGQL